MAIRLIGCGVTTFKLCYYKRYKRVLFLVISACKITFRIIVYTYKSRLYNSLDLAVIISVVAVIIIVLIVIYLHVPAGLLTCVNELG